MKTLWHDGRVNKLEKQQLTEKKKDFYAVSIAQAETELQGKRTKRWTKKIQKKYEKKKEATILCLMMK